MQLDAIHDHGRIEFQTHLNLRHQRFRVRIAIPDAVPYSAPICPLPTFDLAEFGPEVQRRVERLDALRRTVEEMQRNLV
jgi:hypothetical protein